MSELYTRYIKISKKDKNGDDNSLALSQLSTITIPFSNGKKGVYDVLGITEQLDYYSYLVEYKSVSNIYYQDSASLEYDFEAKSFIDNNNSQTSPFSTTSSVDYLPISTLIIDNQEFFNGANSSYKFNTLYQKDLTFQFSGTAGYNDSSNIALGVYRYNPSTPINEQYLGALYEYELSEANSSDDFNGLFIVPPGTIKPGDEIKIGWRRIGGSLPTTQPVLYFLESTLKISSSPSFGEDLILSLEPSLEYKFSNSDCDILQNNAMEQRLNPYTQDMDFLGSQSKPTNYIPLINYQAKKSTVPESNYTQLSNINSRYKGSKNQSSDFNVYDPLAEPAMPQLSLLYPYIPANQGTYGQTPSVSSQDVNLYEFDWGKDASPLIPGGGLLKLGKVLTCNSTSSVKPIDPGANQKYLQVPPDGFFKGVYNNPSTLFKYGRKRLIKKYFSDLKSTLENNNRPGHKVSLYTYAKSSKSSKFPPTTEIITTEFGVPSKPNFIVASNQKYGSSVWGAGDIRTTNSSDIGTHSYLRLFETRNIFYSKNDFSYGRGVGTSLLYNGIFVSTGGYGPSSWQNITSNSRISSMVPINQQLNKGERWFVTFFENFDLTDINGSFSETGELDINTDELRPFILNDSILGQKGIIEISGIERVTHPTGYYNYYLHFKDIITTLQNNELRKIGGIDQLHPTLGMMLWRALSPGRSQYIIVNDEMDDLANGAFTSIYAPDYLKDNIEKISKEFGSNKT